MFKFVRKTLVYRSKDRDDWTAAKDLLQKEGIEYFPYQSEESPTPSCCGAEVDPRTFLNKKKLPTTIYQLEVLREDGDRARQILDGKVLPIRNVGFSL